MLNRQTLKGLSQFTLLLVGLMVLLAVTGHCAITKQAGSKNSIGYEPYYTNPYQYMYGSAVAGQVLKDAKGRLFTTMVFQPSHTFQLYTEEVLFCGNQAEQFNGEAGRPLVITYERVAHQKVDGIGCHQLESVDEVKDKEAQ